MLFVILQGNAKNAERRVAHESARMYVSQKHTGTFVILYPTLYARQSKEKGSIEITLCKLQQSMEMKSHTTRLSETFVSAAHIELRRRGYNKKLKLRTRNTHTNKYDSN